MSAQPAIEFLPGHAGTRIAVHRLGAGRPVVMLHGLASSAYVNWIRYGHAAKVAAAGFEAVMLDLRCHGKSDAPHDPAAYPPDAAVLDIEAVLNALDLGDDFDLVGYSLGARCSVALISRGLAPRRLVLGGMGYETLTHWEARRDHFMHMLDRFEVSKLGDEDYLAIQFMKQMQVDPVAVKMLLSSTSNIGSGLLAHLTMPALVVAGSEDREIGSPARLAEHMPDARYETVPGNHMSCVTKPELGAAIAQYLAS